jgi:hypothetical protein
MRYRLLGWAVWKLRLRRRQRALFLLAVAIVAALVGRVVYLQSRLSDAADVE